MLKIGEKIKKARKIRQITQSQLAKITGVSDKSISAYESNRVKPPVYVLEKIARMTGQSISFFLEDSPEGMILSKLREIEKQFTEIKAILEKIGGEKQNKS